MSSKADPYISPEEYLAIERQAEFRSEYIDGEVYAMAGASKSHNTIVGNLNRLIGTQLLDRPCSVYSNDMRVKVAATGKYYYPDVVAVCGEETFEDAQTDTLLNPQLIIEVLSPSTEAYDRGGKFEQYQRIGSLVEYVMVSQATYRVEQYTRESEHAWSYSEHRGADAVLRLKSIGCEMTLKEIYIKVNLNPPLHAGTT